MAKKAFCTSEIARDFGWDRQTMKGGISASADSAGQHQASALQFSKQMRADQEAGNHEENINTDVAARKVARKEMIQNDKDYSNRA